MRNISLTKYQKNKVIFESSTGLLEGMFSIGREKPVKKMALILPPDPMFKATMNNRIVKLLFKVLESNGFATLKINYRGVGESKELNQNQSHTKTPYNDMLHNSSSNKNSLHEDKMSDALESLDWLIKQCESNDVPNPEIFIAGFALGGWIALQCAMRRPEITNFITINAPFQSGDFNMLTPCPNGLIIQSKQDCLYNLEDSIQFHSQLIVQKGSIIQHKTLDDDHAFQNDITTLEEQVNCYLKSMESLPIHHSKN